MHPGYYTGDRVCMRLGLYGCVPAIETGLCFYYGRYAGLRFASVHTRTLHAWKIVIYLTLNFSFYFFCENKLFSSISYYIYNYRALNLNVLLCNSFEICF